MCGLAPLTFTPISTIPPLPFSEFVLFCSLVLRTLLAWCGTKHRTLPPPPYRPRRECDHSIPGIGLDGPVSLPFRPTITTGSAPPKRKPRIFHAGSTWVGSTAPPSCLMRHDYFTDDTFGDVRGRGPYRDTIDSCSDPKLSSGLFRPTRSLPIR